MIDTVALRIDKSIFRDFIEQSQWEVLQPELFTNSAIEYYTGNNWHKWNKRSQEKQLQDYYPHVEIRKGECFRKDYEYLYVRFSVPKLIYGNNLLEVTDAQFNTVCKTLQTKLETMGIQIGIKVLYTATVQMVHYSKNIICNGVPVELVLERLAASKPCIKGMDAQKTTFRNGQQFTLHNQTREVCFYDKYKELLSYKKKDKKLAWLFKRPDLKNILRIEVRLNKKTSFKRHFKNMKLSFKKVYSEQRAKDVILDYWNTIYEAVQFVPPTCYAPEYQLLSMPRTGVLKKDLQLVSIRALVNSMGYAAAYKVIQALYPKDNVSTLFATLRNVPPLVLPAEYDVLRMIDAELKQFKWLGKHSWHARRKLLNHEKPLIYQHLMTVKDAVKYAKVNKRTLQNWLKEGRIGCFQIGSEYRLRKEDLFALLVGPKL